MVSTYSPNIQLEEPARGDQVGVWDVPVNSNMTVIDRVVGGIATISLNNSNVVLSAAQFQSRMITFNSTLTGQCVITFPTSFTKSYEVQNLCTGSSAFAVVLISGGKYVSCPPGEIVEVVNDGTDMKFKNLGRIGSYWDLASNTIPLWVQICSVPPYLNCDGSAFSAATYPALASILGGTTLPDTRGRFRCALDQGTNRMSVAINGSVLGAGGGDQLLQSHAHANTLTDPGHVHGLNVFGGQVINAAVGGSGNFNSGPYSTPGLSVTMNAALTGIVINNAAAGGGTSQNVPPAYIGGLTLIRSA